MTFREIVYEIQDLSKNISDDSLLNEEHILVIISLIRAHLLHQKYKSIKTEVADSNYQTILVELTGVSEDNCFTGKSICNNTDTIHSINKLPKLMSIGNDMVTPVDYYQDTVMSYVSKEQMKFAGSNSILKNIIYVSKGPDGKLYLKSSNPQFRYLKKVRLTGVFEDAIEASELDCTEDCEILDRVFPLEEGLISTLIDTAVKIIVGSLYKGADEINNASDDLANLANFIRLNVKSALQKQIES